MQRAIFSLTQRTVGAKLTAITLALVAFLFIAAIVLIGHLTASVLEQHSLQQMQNETNDVVNMIEMFDRSETSQVERFASMLANQFPDGFSLDQEHSVLIGDKNTPLLRNGTTDLNLNFSIPDRIMASTGVATTIFAKTGDDFVRISTSLKKENGERAIGTLLDRKHPGYAALLADQPYTGIAKLFGRQYITKYMPLKDASGALIGILFVGVDITQDIKSLFDKIKALKVGESGYFSVFNAHPGADFGTLLAGPEDEGKNLLERKDTDGREFIKDMLTQRQGVMRYMWDNPQTAGHDGEQKIVAFTPFARWGWVIASETYSGEVTREITALRNRFVLYGVLFLLLIGSILYWVIQRLVTQPLARAKSAAERLASGDLTARVHFSQQDEIGQLMEAINGISDGLAMVVNEVRHGTEQITTASSEIAIGNLDLSSRTEQQAGSLAETASAMEQLTTTVQQNADNANQANQLALSASEVAAQGGQVVDEVIATMHSITESSRKIVDIISVIDSIAFQTNILALNAAVEAARAGEQGRGFAVVASEVRGLAQRSATAAGEIKQLIGDSVGKVEAGSQLVEQAGATMRDVVTSVKNVTDIVGDISAASREQSNGLTSINRSIAHMDQTTQQNAALVEQAAAAAQSLQDQAHKLTAAVSAFKLNPSER